MASFMICILVSVSFVHTTPYPAPTPSHTHCFCVNHISKSLNSNKRNTFPCIRCKTNDGFVGSYNSEVLMTILTNFTIIYIFIKRYVNVFLIAWYKNNGWHYWLQLSYIWVVAFQGFDLTIYLSSHIVPSLTVLIFDLIYPVYFYSPRSWIKSLFSIILSTYCVDLF